MIRIDARRISAPIATVCASPRAGDEAALRSLILQAVATKPPAREFEPAQAQPAIVRFMSRTGG